ncbi:hypothetical protein MF407_01060 [Yimella sp. NH-Cas1]|nr:hypothetical protein [Yimella sp. RIT 621]MCG8654192.1 hypothetical protein [Yimella sp. NH-Cas1]
MAALSDSWGENQVSALQSSPLNSRGYPVNATGGKCCDAGEGGRGEDA